MCKCIEEIIALAVEKHGDSCLFDTVQTFNLDTGATMTKAGSLKFSFNDKKSDGTESKKRIKSHISFTFCPFCGEKY